MKRGEIYYANLDPSIGSEANKKRPVVIISNDANNRASATLTILPITSNVSRIYPFEVELLSIESGLSETSKIQCQRIRTISKQHINSAAIGRVNKETLKKITMAIKLHLDME